MIFDLHVHVAGLEGAGEGNYLAARGEMSMVMRLLLRRGLKLFRVPEGAPSGETLQNRLLHWIQESHVDRFVLLALDGVYRRDGSPDAGHTKLVISNEYVANLAARHEKLLFGASLHPYRRDALEELDRWVQRGACLIKWIPSAQNIQTDDPACFAFYERLAHWKIPLLVHTGVEHSLPTFDHALNDPLRLKPALERHVTVIGAHCGSRLFLHESNYYPQWKSMALHYSNFYGDLSAFGSPLQLPLLKEMLKTPALRAKLLYGSDFPVQIMPGWLVFRLGLAQALALRRVRNPFEKTYRTMKALGVPEEVFTKAETLLRMPGLAKPPMEEGVQEVSL